MFTDATIDSLAATIAAAVVDQLPQATPTEDRWMGSADAAAYLGLSLDALHKLTGARALPFSQDTPGGRCYFQRSQLDAWRLASGTTPVPVTLDRA